MGGFTAEIGTVYHSLFDSALTAFAIETQSPVQLACYGDPAGMDVRCESKSAISLF